MAFTKFGRINAEGIHVRIQQRMLWMIETRIAGIRGNLIPYAHADTLRRTSPGK
jgi:hypothetical protein